MTYKTEPNTLGDGIKYEAPNFFSREKVTVAEGESLALLEVIGKILFDCPEVGDDTGLVTGNGDMDSVAAGPKVQVGTYTMTCVEGGGAGAITTPIEGTPGTNTGTGDMTGVAAGAAVQAGTYTMICKDATTPGSEVFSVMAPNGAMLPDATVDVAYENPQIEFIINRDGTGDDFILDDSFTVLASAADGDSGRFAVKAPDGTALPDATVGVAYENEQINFTINDGATDYAVGDAFEVEVEEGSGEVVALDPDAVDGSQIAYGIMCLAVDATSAAADGAAIVRDAMYAAANLVWPDGITADEKAAAAAQLADAGVIAVTLA